MFGSMVLEVAIGVVFVYLLLSLMVTAITELISGWLKWRSDNLWQGILNLVDSVESGEATTWAKKLYAHPLIQELSHPKSRLPTERPGFLQKINPFAVRASGPSYIPSRTFVIALLEAIKEDNQAPLKTLRNVIDATPDSPSISDLKPLEEASKALPDSGTLGSLKTKLLALVAQQDASLADAKTKALALIGALDSQATSKALRRVIDTTSDSAALSDLKRDLVAAVSGLPTTGELGDLKSDLTALVDRLPANVVEAKNETRAWLGQLPDRWGAMLIENLPDSKLKRSLTAMLDESHRDLELFKENLEVWFNNSMTRVSGWYKRKTQIVHMVLALTLTFAVNVDSLLIVDSLSRNQTLRQAVVAQAEAYAKEENTKPAGDQAKTDQTQPKQAPPPAEHKNGAPAAKDSTPANKESSTSSGGQKKQAQPEQTPPPEEPANSASTVKNPTSDQTDKSVAAAAGGAKNEENYQKLYQRISALNLPIGWHLKKADKATAAATDKTKDTTPKNDKAITPDDKTNDATQKDDKAAAPADKTNAPSTPTVNEELRQWPGWCGSLWGQTILFHLFGWLLTAFAISLGAPFWFDLLNKFINIRSAGTAPEEKQKSPKVQPKPAGPGQAPAK